MEVGCQTDIGNIPFTVTVHFDTVYKPTPRYLAQQSNNVF